MTSYETTEYFIIINNKENCAIHIVFILLANFVVVEHVESEEIELVCCESINTTHQFVSSILMVHKYTFVKHPNKTLAHDI